MKIVVTGGHGQLGSCLKNFTDTGISKNQYIYLGHEDLDLEKKEDILNYVATEKPDIIVNCAAYTNVTKAESEKERAYAINSTAVANLADICGAYGAYLIHISTDFVYDGNNANVHYETSPLNPLNTYAKSKLEGENNVLKWPRTMVIRTSWLYSPYCRNFVKTVWNCITNGKSMKVVNDQIGSPTCALDLAAFIFTIIENDAYIGISREIFNFCNQGIASKYDLAKMTEMFVNALNGNANKKSMITSCSTEEFDDNAPRPKFSVMSSDKIHKTFNIEPRYWVDSLASCISMMINDK